MKKIIPDYLTLLKGVLVFILSGTLLTNVSYSNTATVSANYYIGNGGYQNGCICGVGYDYFTSADPVSMRTREFINPLPAGSIVSSIDVIVYGTNCNSSDPSDVYLNGLKIGDYVLTSNCDCGDCFSASFTYSGAGNYSYCNNIVRVDPTGSVGTAITKIDFVLTYTTPSNSSIATSDPSIFTFCPTSSLTISHNQTGTFNPGNVFTAFLSDATGDFTNEVAIGTLNDVNPGNINVTIPGNTPIGSGYRIRVKSSDPYVIGCDNGIDLTVGSPSVSFASLSTLCSNDAPITLTEGSPGGGTYTGTGVSNGIFDPATSGSGTFTLTYTIDNGNGCANSATQQITINTAPSAVITAMGNTTFCQGGSVTLEASIGDVYDWSTTENTQSINVTTTGDYMVAVISANGCYDVSAPVHVEVNALPNVSGGLDQDICAGNLATLNGSGATSYSWDNGVQDGIPFTPSGTVVYTVIGTDNNGCTNSSSVTITVHSQPTVSAGPDQEVCEGAQVTLTGLSLDPVIFTWDNNAQNNIPFVITSTTQFTLTATDAYGCSNTSTMMVYVNPKPIVNAGNDQTVCSGSSVTLNGSGANTYSWDNGIQDGVAFVPSGTTVYNVIGTDLNGCTNTSSATVTVNPLPVATITPNGSTSICPGGSVDLTVNSASSYSWNNGSTTQTITVSSNGTYSVDITDGNGCTGTSSSVSVTVNAPPTVSAGNNQTVCEGQSVTLNGSGATTYNWDNNVQDGVPFTATSTTIYTVIGTDNNGCNNTSSVTITVNPLPSVSIGSFNAYGECNSAFVLTGGIPSGGIYTGIGVTNGSFDPSTGAGNYTVTYSYTDNNGCSNNASTNITVDQLPVVSAGSYSAFGECVTDVMLKGYPSGGTFSGTGVWNNTFHPFSTGSGTYQIDYSYTDDHGCTGTNSTSITVNPTPTAKMSPFNDDLCVNGAPMSLTNGLPAGGVFSGVGVSNNVFDPSVAGIGTFAITYTYNDGFGCSSSASQPITVTVCSGVQAVSKTDASIRLYPNPAHDEIFVEIPDVVSKLTSITIADITGKELIKTETLKNKTQLNIGSLAKGAYIISIENVNSRIVNKLIIE